MVYLHLWQLATPEATVALGPGNGHPLRLRLNVMVNLQTYDERSLQQVLSSKLDGRLPSQALS